MIAVLHDKDILSVRTDKLYEGIILCPMKQRHTDTYRIFILNGKGSYFFEGISSEGAFGRGLYKSTKTSEALLLRNLVKAVNEEDYLSIQPPIMWEWGEDQLTDHIKKMTPYQYLNSKSW